MRCLFVTFVYCVETAKDYGHSCYGMRIKYRTKAFEWYHFQLPSVTPNLDLNVMILFNIKQIDNGTR